MLLDASLKQGDSTGLLPISNFLMTSPAFPSENITLFQIYKSSPTKITPCFTRTTPAPQTPSTSYYLSVTSASTHHITSTITSTTHRYITPSRTQHTNCPELDLRRFQQRRIKLVICFQIAEQRCHIKWLTAVT